MTPNKSSANASASTRPKQSTAELVEALCARWSANATRAIQSARTSCRRAVRLVMRNEVE